MPPGPSNIPSLPALAAALSSFTASGSSFRLLTSSTSSTPTPPITTPLTASSLPSPPPKSLFILDSSFNPPTLAHFALALSALRCTDHERYPAPRRLLLLLSVANADKAVVPASLEVRLGMMCSFAEEVARRAGEGCGGGAGHGKDGEGRAVKGTNGREVDGKGEVVVDVALTTQPYFHAKSRAIEESGVYAPQPSNASRSASDAASNTAPEASSDVDSGPTHIHVLGFDTLVRLLDTKYYPPAHTLAPLTPLFSKHRLRVHLRPGETSQVSEQEEFIAGLQTGGLLKERGGSEEWCGRIEVVRRTDGGEGVSSSLVRGRVREGGEWEGLVTEGVSDWIGREALYKE